MRAGTFTLLPAVRVYMPARSLIEKTLATDIRDALRIVSALAQRKMPPTRGQKTVNGERASERLYQFKSKRHTIEIWLILPVVICLFQGLSHACLRITALQESAHGSLHQT